MIIYKVINKMNDKCYVGVTSVSLSERWANHTNKSNTYTRIARAINKIGKHNFEIIEIERVKTKKEGLKRERYWIEKLSTTHPNGYNMPPYTHDTSKPIICITNKKTYRNIAEAGKLLNLDSSSITKCCKGKLKQTSGYQFQYKDKKLRTIINEKWLNSNSSEYKGVHWDKKRGKWVATIHPDRKSVYLGAFDKEIDAHKSYTEARKHYFDK